MKYIQDVALFMAVMGQKMPPVPAPQPAEIITLRHELIREENEELKDAAMMADIVGIADALCDLRYVVEGAFVAYGFSPVLADELFAEVQRSNMSKACVMEEEAQMTQIAYREQGIATHITKVGSYWIVARDSDNKVMKSVNWSEPDIAGILRKHGVQC